MEFRAAFVVDVHGPGRALYMEDPIIMSLCCVVRSTRSMYIKEDLRVLMISVHRIYLILNLNGNLLHSGKWVFPPFYTSSLANVIYISPTYYGVLNTFCDYSVWMWRSKLCQNTFFFSITGMPIVSWERYTN